MGQLLRRITYSIVCGLFLVGCALQPDKQADSTLVWPKPPAEPRIVYETRLYNQDSLNVPTASKRFQSFATGQLNQSVPSVFVKPYDVAAHAGLIVVSDTRAGNLWFFDVPRQRVFAVGQRGEGRLIRPLGVAIDHNNKVYVADDVRKQIIVYDRLGHYITSIGKAEQFARLIDVAVTADGEQIYALDRGGVESDWHRISHYNASGGLQKIIGKRGAGKSEFLHPNQISLAPNGNIFVLDAGNFRVQELNESGEFVRAWGKLGVGLGSFARPRGLAVDANGYVYVTDSAFQILQIFNQQGQLLLPLGEPGKRGPAGFLLPAGVAVDETGRIYIVDQLARKVDVLRLLSDQERQQWRQP